MARRFHLRVLFLSFMIAFAADAWATPDVNLDNQVDVVDVQLTVNLILSLTEPVWPSQGNVNGDAARDVVDVQLIVNEILGLSGGPLSIPDPGPVIETPVGIAWSRRIFALGGSGQRVFSLGPGAPTWLSVTPDGMLQGTPTSVGPHPVLLRVTSGTATASRVVAITATNLPPAVENEIIYAIEGSTFVSTISGVLANDTDPDGHSLTASIVMYPEVGQLTMAASGYFSVSVPNGAGGVLGFAYDVSDGYGGVTRGSVKVIVVQSPLGEPRADMLLLPAIVRQDSSMRVSVRVRPPVGQSIVGVTALIEQSVQLIELSPRPNGTPIAGTSLYGGVLSSTGLVPGHHTAVVTVGFSGGGSVSTRHRLLVYTRDPVRVGPGFHTTLAAAGTAALQGDLILVAPGAYEGTGNTNLQVKHLGTIGCEHGFHAARLHQAGSTGLTALAGEVKAAFGMTFIQSPTSSVSAVNVTGVGSGITLVACRFVGTPAAASGGRSGAITLSISTHAVIEDCEFETWWRSSISTGQSSNAGAITVRTGATAEIKDSSFIRCRNVNAEAGTAVGGAISAVGASGAVREVRVTVSRCRFIECSIQGSYDFYGGAIGASWASVTVSDSLFEGNFAQTPSSWGSQNGTGMFVIAGGAMAAKTNGVIDVYRCTFRNNRVSGQNVGSPTNMHVGGAALYAVDYSSIVADQCHFEGNTLYQSVGAIANVRGSVALTQRSSALRLEHCTMIGNGIYGATSIPAPLLAVDGVDRGVTPSTTVPSHLHVFNCLAAQNGAAATGHFVLVERSSPTSVAASPVVNVRHSTFAAPVAQAWAFPLGGASLSSQYGSLTLINSVIWAPTIPAATWAGIANGAFSYSAVGPMQTTGIAFGPGIIISDPMLDSAATWLLLSGSPAINAGSGNPVTAGLSGRTALASLLPDAGFVDLGFHAPMPTAGPFPFTSTSAYVQGHQLALHAAYAAQP